MGSGRQNTIDERRRVKAMLARDRDDAARDYMRAAAEIEVAKGKFVNLSDTVLPPTDEWLAKGETMPFTPAGHDGTARTVSTVRRVLVSVPDRMARRGELDEDGLKACRWYAMTHEMAGLDPTIPSVDVGREVFSAPSGRVIFSERQQEAQSEWRAVRSMMPQRYLRFFDAVVLGDVPVARAKRYARMGRDNAKNLFRRLAERAYREIDAIGGLE